MAAHECCGLQKKSLNQNIFLRNLYFSQKLLETYKIGRSPEFNIPLCILLSEQSIGTCALSVVCLRKSPCQTFFRVIWISTNIPQIVKIKSHLFILHTLRFFGSSSLWLDLVPLGDPSGEPMLYLLPSPLCATEDLFLEPVTSNFWRLFSLHSSAVDTNILQN